MDRYDGGELSGPTRSQLLAREARRQAKENPGPVAEFLLVLVSEYEVAVRQALKLEAEIHKLTKDAV
jgi:hypothetical protein